jgi:hypothetical protein
MYTASPSTFERRKMILNVVMFCSYTSEEEKDQLAAPSVDKTSATITAGKSAWMRKKKCEIFV